MLGEYFTKGKHKYVGTVEHHGIKIRKRKTFFSFSKNSCLIEGKFREKDDKLTLETTIRGYSDIKIYIYTLLVFFALYYVGFNLVIGGEPLVSIIPSLLVESFLLLLVPLFIIKLRIKGMKLTLEKDIYNWVKK